MAPDGILSPLPRPPTHARVAEDGTLCETTHPSGFGIEPIFVHVADALVSNVTAGLVVALAIGPLAGSRTARYIRRRWAARFWARRSGFARQTLKRQAPDLGEAFERGAGAPVGVGSEVGLAAVDPSCRRCASGVSSSCSVRRTRENSVAGLGTLAEPVFWHCNAARLNAVIRDRPAWQHRCTLVRTRYGSIRSSPRWHRNRPDADVRQTHPRRTVSSPEHQYLRRPRLPLHLRSNPSLRCSRHASVVRACRRSWSCSVQMRPRSRVWRSRGWAVA
jgi:hypothetical protein